MKNLVFISILFIAFTFSVVAQNSCPTITVVGPSALTAIGDSMTFTAKVEGIESEKIKFEWIISNGTISSGQGTSTIIVATDPDMAGQTVTAFIEIDGLPQDCKNEVSESGEVAPPPPLCRLPITIDDYGKLSWRNEKARLQYVARELANYKDSIAYFVVQTKGKNRSIILKSREAKIKKYLFEKFEIAKDRLIFVDSGNGENNTRIYIMLKSAPPPQ